MLPKQSEIEIPLLEALVELGGEARAVDVYDAVSKKFPNLTSDDLKERLPSRGNRWTNRIQWTRLILLKKDEVESGGHGIWRITEKGRARLGQPHGLPLPDFLELYEQYEEDVKSRLLTSLQDLTPRSFEEFGRRLLEAYDFEDVEVTSVSRDGGIDGHGKLRVGLATMDAAFQCKRWQGKVGVQQVNEFRGAIAGRFQQGIFFTTSDFTPAARDRSIIPGAIPIVLLNGRRIVELMLAKCLGVQRVPAYVFFERVDELTGGSEEV